MNYLNIDNFQSGKFLLVEIVVQLTSMYFFATKVLVCEGEGE